MNCDPFDAHLLVYGTNLYCLNTDVFSEVSPKRPRHIHPLHAISPVPPVQRMRQALPEITGVTRGQTI